RATTPTSTDPETTALITSAPPRNSTTSAWMPCFAKAPVSTATYNGRYVAPGTASPIVMCVFSRADPVDGVTAGDRPQPASTAATKGSHIVRPDNINRNSLRQWRQQIPQSPAFRNHQGPGYGGRCCKGASPGPRPASRSPESARALLPDPSRDSRSHTSPDRCRNTRSRISSPYCEEKQCRCTYAG